MPVVSTVLNSIGEGISAVAEWFGHAAPYAGWVSSTFEGLLWDIAFKLEEVAIWFYDVSDEFEGWWDNIGNLWTDLGTLFVYAHTTLKGLIDAVSAAVAEAWDKAVAAWDKAVDAYDYSYGWLTNRANEAWSRAGETWGTVTNWCKDKAIDAYSLASMAFLAIAASIDALRTELTNWVNSIPDAISTFVLGVKDDIVVWLATYVPDIVATAMALFAAPINLISYWFDDIQNFFNDPLGWLLDRFGDWFFGPEK